MKNRQTRRWEEKRRAALEAQARVAAANRVARERAKEVRDTVEAAMKAAEHVELHAKKAADRIAAAEQAERDRLAAIDALNTARTEADRELAEMQSFLQTARDAAGLVSVAIERAEQAARLADSASKRFDAERRDV